MHGIALVFSASVHHLKASLHCRFPPWFATPCALLSDLADPNPAATVLGLALELGLVDQGIQGWHPGSLLGVLAGFLPVPFWFFLACNFMAFGLCFGLAPLQVGSTFMAGLVFLSAMDFGLSV